MVNIATITIFVNAFHSCNTSNHAYAIKTNSSKSSDAILIDKDDNRYPIKILPDNNLWMISNLKVKIPGSYCYDNTDGNCVKYGRLYTWQSAKEACKLLGDGWHLPGKEEWQKLSLSYSGVVEDSIEARKSAYHSLMDSSNAQFNAILGGGRDINSEYARLNAHGFYWTATEFDSSSAWYANFAKGSQALYMQDGGEKTRAFSVRCVKRIDTSR